VPTTAAVEATETATHMAEASDMGDTQAVGETATPEMGDTVGETVTSHMGDIYAVVETHAVMDDAPISADAAVEAVTSEVGEPQAVVDAADTASHSMVETLIAEVG
jgi:hypothetical protein